QKWLFRMHPLIGRSASPAQSGVALIGNAIYFGCGAGMFALNASTGAIVWGLSPNAAIISSPAVTGAPGNQALFVGDFAGGIDAFSVGTGAKLLSIATGGFIFSSAAVSGGQVFITSTDSNLYAVGT